MYKKHLQLLFSLCSIFLLSTGCSYLVNPLYLSKGEPVQPLVFNFADGKIAQYFYLKKNLLSVKKSPTNPITYVFVVGGSDCASFAYFLPQYFRGLEGESGDVHIYMLQKRYISPYSWGRVWGCSHKFVRSDHPEQWLADQAEFIRQQLSSLPQAPKQRVVLLGISEGGEIAPILAQRIPETTHLVILANGGLDPLDAYALQRSKQGLVIPEKLNALLEKQVLSEPENSSLILGRTESYWLQISKIQQIENLLLLNIPILMAMGMKDQVVPIESAWYAKEIFEKQSNKNLTLITYPEADHSLASQKKNFLPDFFHKMDMWLNTHLD